MSIFEEFKRSKELVGETCFVKIYKLVYKWKEYRIVITRRFATKRMLIHLADGFVYREQVPLFSTLLSLVGGSCRDISPIYKWDKEKDVVTIFVIRGRPGDITGLDAGIFRSANNFDEDYLNVMSYRRFKKI